MQYQIDQFKVLVSHQEPLEIILKRTYSLTSFTYKILNRSIDARNKKEIYYVYRLLLETKDVLKGKGVTLYKDKSIKLAYPTFKEELSPVIIGFGPAGIFASLYLARCHAHPIIIERGASMEERIKDVKHFLETKELNPNSNVQFGEGGAGTFSDGKLNTNVKSPYISFILEELVAHGASPDILYESMPHIGTDVLRRVVINIRKEIEALGGKFYFRTTFKSFLEKEDRLIVFTESFSFETRYLLLGIGHSAKDTLRYLYHEAQLRMEPKAFSMGVRVEHRAKDIDEAQYGTFATYLPKAYYKLSYHINERGIYTFCMCPGGYVLASASEPHTIVTNGMSNQKRENENSNSAILVDVHPEDFQFDIEQGFSFQEKYEQLAFLIAGDYRAPANLMKEFMEDKVARELRSIPSSYPHGIIFCDLKRCLPDFVIEGIKEGILNFDKKMKGFYHPDAVLIGVETRSSSPVRIIRDSQSRKNRSYIYPIGEGAGYAGGIISAALDGLRTAITIMENPQNLSN